jgi:hypothetical protein
MHRVGTAQQLRLLSSRSPVAGRRRRPLTVYFYEEELVAPLIEQFEEERHRVEVRYGDSAELAARSQRRRQHPADVFRHDPGRWGPSRAKASSPSSRATCSTVSMSASATPPAAGSGRRAACA